MMSASFVKPDHQRARKSIYNNYRNAARNREHKFELSFEEFSKLIVDNCHYCGEAPSTLWPDQYIKRAAVWYQHPTDFYYNGIDRSDNAIGYIPSNCVTACKFCNRSKNTMSIGEWLAWVKRLYEFQNLKEAACGV
jgi:5-methylcytosine-specific restriction endonuclease McrA